ncbi:MAG TPA: ABC transporter ATP-binding protein [Woeseiaceae bacterium]|nr:ABC transporter ATP-binding protein [Woeseiaceae bacterium]
MSGMYEDVPAALSCRDLTVAVPGRRLVASLDLELGRGDFLAVLGQNGAGKTLTLLTLAGLRTPDAGQVRLGNRPVDSLKRTQVARELGLLPQSVDDVFPATVLQTVLVGRHPHIGPFGWEKELDRRLACRSLEDVDLAPLAEREVATLSGGERRRAAIAQVLAQDPAVYLLDEPTNHLDPQHQLDVLQLFGDRTRAGAAVIATLHDVNLAVRFANRCLLLYGDGRWDLGPTESVLNESRLSELYAVPMEAVRWRGRDLFIPGGNPV